MEKYKRRRKMCNGLISLKNELRRLKEDESGVGVIEVVLILVVLIGLVAVFKTQINELLTKIFGSISSMSDEIL